MEKKDVIATVKVHGVPAKIPNGIHIATLEPDTNELWYYTTCQDMEQAKEMLDKLANGVVIALF